MPTLLSQRLVDSSLAALTEWSGDTSQITRTIRLDSPDQVVELLGDVDVSAKSLQHEPVVERDGTAVTFTLSTPDVGGVSEVDISFASRIDNLAGRVVGAPPTPAPRTTVPDDSDGQRLGAGPGRNHPPDVTVDRAEETATGRSGAGRKGRRGGGGAIGVSSLGNDGQLRPGVAVPDDRPGHPEPGPAPEQRSRRRSR